MVTRLPGIYALLRITVVKEITVSVRRRSDLANPLIFFLCVMVFVPLGISPDDAVLAPLAPGMIWIMALLATLLSLDRLFQSDYEDGCLAQSLVSGQPLYWGVLAKVLVHWLMTGLPLTLLAPLLGLMMALPAAGYGALVLSLFLGTGSLSLIGAIGAALTVALRRGGLLLSLIIMPLYVPVLIFGASVVKNAIIDGPVIGQVAILAAFFLLSMVLAPLACAAALRVSING